MRSRHLYIDERSIALHRAVVEKIRLNPQLLDIAKANLQRQESEFLRQCREIPGWLKEWAEILKHPDIEYIFSFLVSKDEKARRLRQSSPFSGILTPRERWRVYDAFRTGAHNQGRRQYHG